MDELIGLIYKFLCFRNTMTGGKKRLLIEMNKFKILKDLSKHPDFVEFMEECGKPGNELYASYMIEKVNNIKSKINEMGNWTDGI